VTDESIAGPRSKDQRFLIRNIGAQRAALNRRPQTCDPADDEMKLGRPERIAAEGRRPDLNHITIPPTRHVRPLPPLPPSSYSPPVKVDMPLSEYEKNVRTHALLVGIAFLVILPIGALVPRYLRTFTNRSVYSWTLTREMTN